MAPYFRLWAEIDELVLLLPEKKWVLYMYTGPTLPPGAYLGTWDLPS
jgi:hypothetical protein